MSSEMQAPSYKPRCTLLIRRTLRKLYLIGRLGGQVLIGEQRLGSSTPRTIPEEERPHTQARIAMIRSLFWTPSQRKTLSSQRAAERTYLWECGYTRVISTQNRKLNGFGEIRVTIRVEALCMTQEMRRTEQIARDATTVVTAVVAKRTGIAVDAERHIYSVKE